MFVEKSVEIVNNRMYIYGVSTCIDRIFVPNCGKLTDYAKNHKINKTAEY